MRIHIYASLQCGGTVLRLENFLIFLTRIYTVPIPIRLFKLKYQLELCKEAVEGRIYEYDGVEVKRVVAVVLKLRKLNTELILWEINVK